MEEQRITELAHYFVTSIAIDKANLHGQKMFTKAHDSIKSLLEEGWTIEALYKTLYENATKHPLLAKNAYSIRDVLGKTEPPSNLIDPLEFYYHNELRVEQVVARKTVVDGKLVTQNDQGFKLEIKKYYSEEDFIDYFYKKMRIPKPSNADKRDKGRLKHLLEQCDIDTLLFAIDIMYEERRNRGLKISPNIFSVQDYLPEAEDAVSRKRNQHRLLNINKEVY